MHQYICILWIHFQNVQAGIAQKMIKKPSIDGPSLADVLKQFTDTDMWNVPFFRGGETEAEILKIRQASSKIWKKIRISWFSSH